MAMVREAHVQLKRQRNVSTGAGPAAKPSKGVAFAVEGEDEPGGEGEAGEGGEPALRREDVGADSYMLRIFGEGPAAGDAAYGWASDLAS
jgi:hypothetical protein